MPRRQSVWSRFYYRSLISIKSFWAVKRAGEDIVPSVKVNGQFWGEENNWNHTGWSVHLTDFALQAISVYGLFNCGVIWVRFKTWAKDLASLESTSKMVEGHALKWETSFTQNGFAVQVVKSKLLAALIKCALKVQAEIQPGNLLACLRRSLYSHILVLFRKLDLYMQQ